MNQFFYIYIWFDPSWLYT